MSSSTACDKDDPVLVTAHALSGECLLGPRRFHRVHLLQSVKSSLLIQRNSFAKERVTLFLGTEELISNRSFDDMSSLDCVAVFSQVDLSKLPFKERFLAEHSYKLGKKVYEGSFGQMLMVHDGAGKKRICKMVHCDMEAQSAFKEVKLLCVFKHPYIVRYRDTFTDNGYLCIVMDLCNAGDLEGRIGEARQRKTHIPEDHVLRWCTQAILALKYVHEKQAIHGNLKPCNIMLSKNGNVKLGSFAIQAFINIRINQRMIYNQHKFIYVSPELCDNQPYRAPSDIWAMGCILYRLCALKDPFEARNIIECLQNVCRGPTPPFPAGYSEFLKELCSKMLEKRDSARPSADEILMHSPMQSAIEQFILDAVMKVAAEQPSPPESLKDGVRSISSPALVQRSADSATKPNQIKEGSASNILGCGGKGMGSLAGTPRSAGIGLCAGSRGNVSSRPGHLGCVRGGPLCSSGAIVCTGRSLGYRVGTPDQAGKGTSTGTPAGAPGGFVLHAGVPSPARRLRAGTSGDSGGAASIAGVPLEKDVGSPTHQLHR